MTSDAYATTAEPIAAAFTPATDEASSASAVTVVPPAVELFARHLVVAWKAVLLYPRASDIPRHSIGVATGSLRAALAEAPALVLSINKRGISYSDVPLFPGHASYEAFARELYTRNLAELRFGHATDERALTALLEAFREDAEGDVAEGGLEAHLAGCGVESIGVSETRVALVDASAGGAGSLLSIDLALGDALEGGSEGHRVLQLMVGDVEQVTSYVIGEGGDSGVSAKRVTDLAAAAFAWPGPDGLEFQRTIAAGIEAVPIEQRRGLLADHLLPQSKSDPALGAIMREMYLSTLFDSLIREEPKTSAERAGLARAIKNLALMSGADRRATLSRAGDAMTEAGFAPETVGDIISAATPARITLADETGDPDGDQPVDTILQMLGLATKSQREEEHAALLALKAEAGQGVTDGDIVATLVSLIAIRTAGPHFDVTMRLIDESMPLLIERGEFRVAAESARSLAAAAAVPGTPAANAMRMNAAIEQLVRPVNVRSLLHAARRLPKGDPERAAAMEILEVFGERALDPLLDVLADESDRTVRKQLVELLSDLAADYVPEIAARLSDSRWYFVRNVVAVLGAAHRSSTLPYLQRTIRHPESRVRRETIRAISSLSERMALELLAAALDDEDAQNVQLAASALAVRGASESVVPLLRVARGEGRGNRDFQVRVDAIEALGRIGRPEAIPALKQIGGRRGLPRMGGRNRELRAACDAAIARIRVGGGS